ncbi:MAG: tetratricopeptide repeat protein [Planctomycetota bacterium]
MRWKVAMVAVLLAAVLMGVGHGLWAEETEKQISDHLESHFKIKSTLQKGGSDVRSMLGDIFHWAEKHKDNSLDVRVALETIMHSALQDERTLDLARTAASIWIQVYHLPPVECYNLFLDDLKNLHDHGRCDKETVSLELFFQRDDLVKLYLRKNDFDDAIKTAQENKNFADIQTDRDLKTYASNVVANLERRQKLEKQKADMLAQLDPDPDLPAANLTVAKFLLLDSDLPSAAQPYMLKSDDPTLTAFAQLQDALSQKAAFGCRDYTRLGDLALSLSRQATSGQAKQDLLSQAFKAFTHAGQMPEAKTLVDANKQLYSVYIEHTTQAIDLELQTLKRRNGFQKDDLTYLFSHVSFEASPDRPMGADWEYRVDKDNDWSADGAAVTFIKGTGRLHCKTSLQGDFTLSFDIQPMFELQPKDSTVFYGIYFNNGMKAGVQNGQSDSAPHMLFDFGTAKDPTVVPGMSGYNNWTHWDIYQRGGIVSVSVNGRPMFSPNVKSPNAIQGEFEFGSDPTTAFKLRNIRLHHDN